jgi:hypothetical protein
VKRQANFKETTMGVRITKTEQIVITKLTVVFEERDVELLKKLYMTDISVPAVFGDIGSVEYREMQEFLGRIHTAIDPSYVRREKF